MCVNSCTAQVSIKNADSDECALETHVMCSLTVIAGNQSDMEYIDDVYALDSDIKSKYHEVELVKRIRKFDSVSTQKTEADSFDETAQSVEDAYAEDIRYSCEYADDGIKISGSMNINAVIKNSEGAFMLISRSCSFEHTAAVQNIMCNSCFCCVSCTGIGATLESGGKLVFNCEIRYCGIAVENSTLRLLEDVSEAEIKGRLNDENVVLYYGHSGELLWDIAKNNNTTVDIIKTLNETSADVLNEDKVLVFPNY